MSQEVAMNVTLSPQLEAIIRDRVASGLYEDADEVVEKALLLLDDQDRINRLRASIEESERQFERGEYDEWSHELMEKIILEGDEMARRGIAPDPDVCP
jgi:antitoxin ParD1/3/4